MSFAEQIFKVRSNLKGSAKWIARRDDVGCRTTARCQLPPNGGNAKGLSHGLFS